MAKRSRGHIKIGDVLHDFIESNKLQKGIDEIDIREAWNKLMGVAIEKYTTALKLERETLFVRLSSSVLREELSYGKQKIIAMLNEEVGKEIIKKIVFR